MFVFLKKKNDSWRPTIEYPMRSAYREACGKEPGEKQNHIMLIQYLYCFFITTCAVRARIVIRIVVVIWTYCSCYRDFIIIIVQATRAVCASLILAEFFSLFAFIIVIVIIIGIIVVII